jgi:hypothetical protein
MRRGISGSVFVILVVILSAMTVCAQDDTEIYYVRRDHSGCEDGSRECPYNTRYEAQRAGRAGVCVERTFEVWEWDGDEYEYYDTYAGQKPVPGTGVPIALPLLILVIFVGGVILLAVALRLRRRNAS